MSEVQREESTEARKGGEMICHDCQENRVCRLHSQLEVAPMSDEIKIPIAVGATADQYRHEFGDDAGDQVIARWMREEMVKEHQRTCEHCGLVGYCAEVERLKKVGTQ